MKKLPTFLKFFLINLAAALVVMVGISIYVLYWLDDYTEHGTFIVVPDLHHFTPEEAEVLATYNRLQTQVVDSLYDTNTKPGAVVDQYPAPHARVKKGHRIYLTVNATNPEKITIPRLQNSAYRQTLQTLEARGFRIGRLEFVPSEFPNLVLGLKHDKQKVSPGTLLPKGAVIDIILGNDPEKPFIPIPSVTGKTYKEAVDILRKAYFNIGKTIPDGSITRQTNTNNAIVYQQNPETGFSMKRGANIDLYITLNPEKIAALDSLTLTQP